MTVVGCGVHQDDEQRKSTIIFNRMIDVKAASTQNKAGSRQAVNHSGALRILYY